MIAGISEEPGEHLGSTVNNALTTSTRLSGMKMMKELIHMIAKVLSLVKLETLQTSFLIKKFFPINILLTVIQV